MAEKKVYIGSFGPFLFDDTDSIDDSDGDFSGMSHKGLVTDGGIIMGSMDLLDTDASNVLSLVWNEDDTADRTLSILVGGGDRSVELNENLAIADGFDVTLQALGQANSLVLNESLTVGDGHAGTLTFSAASKALTIEDVSALNQDLTTDASPTFDDLTLSTPSNIYALSHDSFADFEEAEHFTMLDEDDMASNSDTQAATQQSVKAYVDYSVTSLGASYYMLDTSSGVSDYKLCSLTPSEDAETYLEAADLSDNDYIGGWISGAGETPDILLTGNFNFYITAEKTTGTKTLKLYWKMYERKSDTSEVLIATSSITSEVTDKDTFILPLLLTSDYIPASGSRIVGKIYASVTGGGNAPTVRIYYQGNTAARWDIPANSEVFRNIFVPYANAVQDVDLNGHSITGIDNITVADESWIGIGASDERIVFDAAGDISFIGCDVGIGKTEPSGKLEIFDSSPILKIYGNNAGVDHGQLQFKGGRGTSYLHNGDLLGEITAYSQGSPDFNKKAGIQFIATGGDYWSPPTDIAFLVSPLNNSPNEAMRIDSSGNIGANTTTPRKQIDSLSTSQAQLRLSYSDNSVYADFQVGSAGELDITPNGSAPNVDITTHNGSTQGLKLGGTLITKNAAEINDLEALVNLPSDEHLVGYWAFDDGSGSVAVDGSGNGNSGTLVNMEDADWVDGVSGKCLSFDGSNERVDLDKTIINDLDSVATVSFWIKPGAYLERYSAWFTSSNTSDKLFDIWRQDATKVYFAVNLAGTGAQKYFSISQAELEGSWHHFVMVVTGARVNAYWDGEYKTGFDYSDPIPTVTSLQIAAWNGASCDNSKFDEVRIYNRALTASEIKALFLYPAGNKGCRITTRQIGQSGDVIAETDETKFSHKMPITIDGTAYYVMLTQT